MDIDRKHLRAVRALRRLRFAELLRLRFDDLRPHEVDVLVFLKEGYSHSDIARAKKVHRGTVGRWARDVFQRLPELDAIMKP